MNLFLNQKYDQHEKFCSDSFRWQMEFNKLSSDKFLGIINLIDIHDLQIGRIKLNGKIEQKGLNPKGYRTVVIPVNNRQSFNWFNTTLSDKDILVFPKTGDLEAVSFSNFYYYMISIKEELLNEIIEKYEFSNLEKMLESNKSVFRLKNDYFIYIQNYLEVQFNLLQENPNLVNSTSFLFKLRYRFTYLIFSFLNTVKYNVVKSSVRKRDAALSSCIDYIGVNKKEKISIPKLVEISNMSERTLQLAFLEKYAVSPKEYINYLKLNEVRRKLLKYNFSKGIISELAHEFGINHMGQFSAAYKKLFNELPKDTLKR